MGEPRAADHMKELEGLALKTEHWALRQSSRSPQEAVHLSGDGKMTGVEKIRFMYGIVQCEINIRDWDQGGGADVSDVP